MHSIDRTDEVYQFIASYLEKHQRPPTLREIMQALDFSSTSVVDRQLQILEELGTISREPFTARGIILL